MESVAVILGLLGVGLLVQFILPWSNRASIRWQRSEIETLQNQMAEVQQELASLKRPVRIAPVTPVQQTASVPASPVQEVSSSPAPAPAPSPVAAPPPPTAAIPATVQATEQEPLAQSQPVREGTKRISLEERFGARMSAWIGGAALILAGFYLIRYSIAHSLVSPQMRLVMGYLFGGGLVALAGKLGPINARIGQASAGAGIAVLFGAVIASAALGFIPAELGMVFMGGTAVLGIRMALRHGTPIAIMALFGGFLAPMMVLDGNFSTPLTLAYLYALTSGFLFIARKQNWWGLSCIAMGITLVWSMGLVVSSGSEEAALVGIFILALGATMVGMTWTFPSLPASAAETDSRIEKYRTRLVKGMNITFLSVGAFIVGASVSLGVPTAINAALLVILAASALALAWFDRSRFAFFPWVALAVSSMVSSGWAEGLHGAEHAPLSFIFLAVLCTSAGIWAFWHVSREKEKAAGAFYWALFAAISATVFYALGFHVLGMENARIPVLPLVSFHFWGGVAIALAGIATTFAARVLPQAWGDEKQKQRSLAVFASFATGFIAIGLTIEIPREFLSVCIAAEMAALAWLAARLQMVPALRTLAKVCAALFALMILNQIILLANLSFFSLFEVKLMGSDVSLPITEWPVFQLGVPAVFFALTSLLVRKVREGDGIFAKTCEVSAIALLSIMGYYLMRHTFHPDVNILYITAGFIERGTFTNILFLAGMACLFGGIRIRRGAVQMTGAVLMAVGIFRLGFFDLALHNPLADDTQQVGDWFLFNGLTLTYALPILWLEITMRKLANAGTGMSPILSGRQGKMQFCVRVVEGILGFAYLNLLVRHIFHGADMTSILMTNAELYAYSALWLILAVATLLASARHKSRPLLRTAILLYILTAVKVFFVDTSGLDDLWRVVSLTVLAVCLFGLTWFYNKYVGSATDADAQ